MAGPNPARNKRSDQPPEPTPPPVRPVREPLKRSDYLVPALLVSIGALAVVVYLLLGAPAPTGLF